MRPTGPMYDLPTPKFAIGDKLDRATLMNGHYAFEKGWYRRAILRDKVRYYRDWKVDNDPGGKICPGHKAAIRGVMRLVDTAYEVEVSGILMRSSQNEDMIANQCYVGAGGSGWSGSTPYATLLFRGEEPRADLPDVTNEVAINITTVQWSESSILEARRVYEARLHEFSMDKWA